MSSIAARTATAPPSPPAAASLPALPTMATRLPLESPPIFFFAFVVLLTIEYLGLGQQYAIIRLSRLPTLLAYGLLLVALSRGGMTFILESKQGRLLGMFVLFTAASVLWAVVRSIVPLQARYHLDYLGLFTITAWLVSDRKRIDQLSVVFVLIAFVLVAQNFGKLLSSSRTGFFKASYFMGDGNDFAWGLLTMLPFVLNLMFGRRWITTRLFGLGGFALIAFATVGTQSRGATLAIGAALFVIWLTISKRKMIGVVIMGVGVVGAGILAPGAYMDRMSSMTDYQADSSAQGRLRAWRSAVHMAIDYPLGVGANNFSRAYGRFYIPEDTSGYKAFRWISPHSVYFRVLGEYGFPGVTMLFMLIYANARDNRAMAHRIRGKPDAYPLPETWPAVLNVGLVAYCVGGIFLGGFAYPHLYFMSGLTIACRRIFAEAEATAAVSAPEASQAKVTAPKHRWPTPSRLRSAGASPSASPRRLS